MLNYVAIYLFIPLPLLLIVSIWLRQSKLLLGLSIPTVAFILLYGSLFTPQLPVQSSADPLDPFLIVMTFNVMFGNEKATDLAATIRNSDADIVGLQEITPELAKALATELNTG